MALEVCVKAAAGAPHILGDLGGILVRDRPFHPKGSSNPGGEETTLPDALDQCQRQASVVRGDKSRRESSGYKWVPDSDVITQLIEEKYPNPSLSTPPEHASVGSKIFPCFVKFLKSKDPSDGSEVELLDALHALDEHLKAHGPYVNGENISAVDLSLAPKLFHLEVVLGHFKGWSIPENLTYVKNYMKLLFSRESFEKTKAAKEFVIAGWAPKVNS